MRIEDFIAENVERGTYTSTTGITAAPPVQAAAQTRETITLAQAQDMALQISTYFEGGKSLNYKALAGDGFDGQGMSFGLIQWNFGQNTLGPLLNKMRAKDEKAFAGCFGKDADYETLKKALTSSDQSGELKWARDLQKNNRDAWSAAFNAIGSNDTFNKIQHDEAIAAYHPLVVKAIGLLRDMSAKLFESIEFRSYAALYDLCVQQRGISNVEDDIQQRITDEKPQTQFEVMKIAVEERANAANPKWVSDCLSRRMGILTGAAYAADENGVKAKRVNPKFDLINASGTKIVTGL